MKQIVRVPDNFHHTLIMAPFSIALERALSPFDTPKDEAIRDEIQGVMLAILKVFESVVFTGVWPFKKINKIDMIGSGWRTGLETFYNRLIPLFPIPSAENHPLPESERLILNRAVKIFGEDQVRIPKNADSLDLCPLLQAFCELSLTPIPTIFPYPEWCERAAWQKSFMVACSVSMTHDLPTAIAAAIETRVDYFQAWDNTTFKKRIESFDEMPVKEAVDTLNHRIAWAQLEKQKISFGLSDPLVIGDFEASTVQAVKALDSYISLYTAIRDELETKSRLHTHSTARTEKPKRVNSEAQDKHERVLKKYNEYQKRGYSQSATIDALTHDFRKEYGKGDPSYTKKTIQSIIRSRLSQNNKEN